MSDAPQGEAPPAPGQRSVPLAARYGLVRPPPQQGRYVAGVCAALGRATGTDPVLWRVVLSVLVCFAGIGILVYLGLWLLTPEVGDTASPVEALLCRGQSSTPSTMALVLGVAAVALLLYAVPRPMHLVLLGGAAVLVVLLLHRHGGPGAADRSAPEPAAGPGPGAAPAPEAGPEAGPAAAPPPGPAPAAETAGETRPDPDRGPAQPAGPAPADPPVSAPPPPMPADASAARPELTAPLSPGAGAFPPAAGPFAPHGPFASAHQGGPHPPRARPGPAAPPRPPKDRSPLAALTFFTMVLAVGALGLLDLTGATQVPAAGYVAAALVVVGAGLLVGAWMGRARALIALGAVLALALPVVQVGADWTPPEHVGTTVNQRPADLSQLDDSYSLAFGDGVVDLREIDFSGAEPEVTIRVSFGELRVQVPERLPVTVNMSLTAGNATVFRDQPVGGLRVRRTVTDLGRGAGEPVDGELTLNLRATFGHIEVER